MGVAYGEQPSNRQLVYLVSSLADPPQHANNRERSPSLHREMGGYRLRVSGSSSGSGLREWRLAGLIFVRTLFLIRLTSRISLVNQVLRLGNMSKQFSWPGNRELMSRVSIVCISYFAADCVG